MRISFRRLCILACIAAVALNLVGCKKTLQGKYVCTQDVDTSGSMGLVGATPDPSKRPTLEFNRDGTFFMSNIWPFGQMQGNYTIVGESLKLSLGGGLEVHSGTINGRTIETDFEIQQLKSAPPGVSEGMTIGSQFETVKLSFVKQ